MTRWLCSSPVQVRVRFSSCIFTRSGAAALQTQARIACKRATRTMNERIRLIGACHAVTVPCRQRLTPDY